MVELDDIDCEAVFNEVLYPTLEECYHKKMRYLFKRTNGEIVIRNFRKGTPSIPINIEYENVYCGVTDKLGELDKRDEEYHIGKEEMKQITRNEIVEELIELIRKLKK